MQSGIKHFRIEFVDEKPEDVIKIINMYRDVCKNIEIMENLNKNSVQNNNSDNDYDNNRNKKTIADRNIESSLMILWKFLEIVPNGYGLPQGVSLGSLKPTAERQWDTLRPTAKRQIDESVYKFCLCGKIDSKQKGGGEVMIVNIIE